LSQLKEIVLPDEIIEKAKEDVVSCPDLSAQEAETVQRMIDLDFDFTLRSSPFMLSLLIYAADKAGRSLKYYDRLNRYEKSEEYSILREMDQIAAPDLMTIKENIIVTTRGNLKYMPGVKLIMGRLTDALFSELIEKNLLLEKSRMTTLTEERLSSYDSQLMKFYLNLIE
jgi:hypothetical protein